MRPAPSVDRLTSLAAPAGYLAAALALAALPLFLMVVGGGTIGGPSCFSPWGPS